MIEDPKFPATSCDTCHGTGAGHTFGCGTCKGRGWVVLPVKVDDPEAWDPDQPCDTCDGTGSLDVTDYDDLGDPDEVATEGCPHCDETGRVRRTAPIVTPCTEGEPHHWSYSTDYGTGIEYDAHLECKGDGVIEVGRCWWTLAPVTSSWDGKADPIIYTDFDPSGLAVLFWRERDIQRSLPDLDVSPGDWVAIPEVTP